MGEGVLLMGFCRSPSGSTERKKAKGWKTKHDGMGSAPQTTTRLDRKENVGSLQQHRHIGGVPISQAKKTQIMYVLSLSFTYALKLILQCIYQHLSLKYKRDHSQNPLAKSSPES